MFAKPNMKRVASLDVIRTLAILFVVVTHASDNKQLLL
jgi:peptidoglycan/LPS O-acetylase OafA/YrhL